VYYRGQGHRPDSSEASQGIPVFVIYLKFGNTGGKQ